MSASPNVYRAGRLHLWFSFKAFEDHYPSITAAQAGTVLGGKDQRDVSADEMPQFIADLDRLFAQIRAAETTGVAKLESLDVTEQSEGKGRRGGLRICSGRRISAAADGYRLWRDT